MACDYHGKKKGGGEIQWLGISLTVCAINVSVNVCVDNSERGGEGDSFMCVL